MSESELSADEKVLAALAHGFNLIGLVVLAPLVIWFIKKDSSDYVSYHAMQSTLYGGVVLAVWIIAMIFSGIVSAIIPPAACAFGILFLLFSFVFWGYALYATIKAAVGSEVNIPLIADWASKITGMNDQA